MSEWLEYFERGLPYDEFLDKYGLDDARQRWQAQYERVKLTDDQRQVLASFQRDVLLLCLASAWCGDCAAQVPILARFASECQHVRLRLLERDEVPELRDQLLVNGGRRIPVVVFLSEDGYEAARYGDRTLHRYRYLAQQELGQPIAGAPRDEQGLLTAMVQDWLNELERVHWLLRLSPRLRKKHCD